MTRRVPRSAIGVTMFVLVFGVYGLVFTGVLSRLFGPSSVTVTAVFRDAKGLSVRAPVRVAGIEMGTVKQITLSPDRRSTVVRMSVYEKALPLYRNATAKIQWRTLLGGAFVVNIGRGDPSAGSMDARTIPVTQTSSQVELEDVTRVLQGDAVTGLRGTLHELPQALHDQTAPRRLLSALDAAAPDATRGIAATRGRVAGDLTRLVHNTAATVRAFDTPAASMRQLVEGGALTLGATARSATALRRTIALVGIVTPRVRATLAETRRTLDGVDPLVAELRGSAAAVAPTARKLRPTLVAADDLLAKARPLVRSLRPAATALATASRQALPLLTDLTPAIRRVDERILPDLAVRSPESHHTTYEMIGPTIASLLGAGSSFDGDANYARLFGSASDRAVDTLPCKTFLADPTSPDLVRCEALQDAIGNYLGIFGGRNP